MFTNLDFKMAFGLSVIGRIAATTFSQLTWKKLKIDNNKLTTIHEHVLCCNYSPSFEDFSTSTRESNDFKLKIMESILIARHKPVLNKADSSVFLELFYYNISGYHMFYHIIWWTSISLCVYNYRLFGFHYYVTSFAFYQKQNNEHLISV